MDLDQYRYILKVYVRYMSAKLGDLGTAQPVVYVLPIPINYLSVETWYTGSHEGAT